MEDINRQIQELLQENLRLLAANTSNGISDEAVNTIKNNLREIARLLGMQLTPIQPAATAAAPPESRVGTGDDSPWVGHARTRRRRRRSYRRRR